MAEEDADIVAGRRALLRQADAVAVDRAARARVAVFHPRDQAGADDVAADVGLRAVDDQHAVVVGQSLPGCIEPDDVFDDLRCPHAAAAHDHAVAGARCHAVARDAVAGNSRAARAAQHGNSAEPVGRRRAAVGRHAQPVLFDQRGFRARADDPDAVAREAADAQPPHGDVGSVDHDSRGIAGLLPVEVDRRRPALAPARLGARVQRDVSGAQRGQLRGRPNGGRAGNRETNLAGGFALRLIRGVDRGAQAAYLGALLRPGVFRRGDGPDAVRSALLGQRGEAAEDRGAGQRADQQRRRRQPLQRAAPGSRAAAATRMCKRTPSSTAKGSAAGASARVV